MKNSHVYMLLGGMTGTALDYPFTLGMFGLQGQLVTAGFPVATYYWGQYAVAARDIAALKSAGGYAIVIGYSGGASRATWMDVPIDLLIGYDPSPAGQVKALSAKVGKAYCYYNAHPMMWWPGVGTIGGGSYVGPQVTTVDINSGRGEFHLAVQGDQSLHAMTVSICRERAG